MQNLYTFFTFFTGYGQKRGGVGRMAVMIVLSDGVMLCRRSLCIVLSAQRLVRIIRYLWVSASFAWIKPSDLENRHRRLIFSFVSRSPFHPAASNSLVSFVQMCSDRGHTGTGGCLDVPVGSAWHRQSPGTDASER